MSNDWLRLWHDMPTDPKWRTIARASGQRIGDVMSVYLFLLVSGSTNATERGRTQSFNAEDVATALDLETDAVESIITAMQGRVLAGDMLRGWVGRQPAREDGAAERAKAWREAQKEAKRAQENASERTPNAPERKRTLDTDTDTEEKDQKPKATPPAAPDGGASESGQRFTFKPPGWVPADAWSAFVDMRRKIRAPLTNHAAKLAVDELAALRSSGDDPEAVLNQSVMNSWRGLFAVKSKVVQMPLAVAPEPIKASHQPLRHTPRG